MIHVHVPLPELVPCVTQVYENEQGWWRYCLTCDDGSNKYRKHPRGHKTEADAQMSARDHAKKAAANRQWRAWHVLWKKAIVAAQTWDEFVAIHEERDQYVRRDLHWPRLQWENIPVEKREAIMNREKELYARP